MARDYAKQKKIPRSNSRSRVTQRKNTTGLWLLAGILIGLFIAGLAYLNNHKQNVKVAAEPAKNIAHKKVKQSRGNKLQPKFDFYTILPKMKVWVPTNNEHNLVTHKPPAPAPITKPLAQQPSAAVINIPATSATLPSKQETATKTVSKIATKKEAATPTKITHYSLQVASLQSYHEADQLKAQLLLMGYNVIIKPMKANHKTLNRVWVGTYTTATEAAKIKQALAQQHIKSILVKISE